MKFLPAITVEINDKALHRAESSAIHLYELLEDWGYGTFFLERGLLRKFVIGHFNQNWIFNLIAIHPKSSSWKLVEQQLS